MSKEQQINVPENISHLQVNPREIMDYTRRQVGYRLLAAANIHDQAETGEISREEYLQRLAGVDEMG